MTMAAGPMGAGVAETHSATVFFLGDRAYKLKKPVDLGFLDFTTREAREAVCHQEVALNRRLAPDVYLGVADVLDTAGALCDHLVVMRRMPADRRLSHLLAQGAPVDGHLWRVAHQLATLHATSARSAAADAAAGAEQTRRRWEANTDDLITRAGGLFDDATVGLVHGLACRYLNGRGHLFQSRVDAGRAVDGHGDLLADDIFCLDDGPRVLDCIEFDEALRLGDGLADAAFLAMDLERLGRPDLAAGFLAAYREHAADSWPDSLVHHHVAYRAQVRAKVTAIRAQQGDASAAPAAVRLLELALEHLEAGRVRLVLVGGLPGTGKSTLAKGLAERLGATLLRSDEVRKEGEQPEAAEATPTALWSGLYSAARTDDVYTTLLARATTALALGETVVLDASWNLEHWRAAARRVASATVADLIELRCEAPRSVAVERIARRHQAGVDPSDATPLVAAAMALETDPWPQATTIDTIGTPEDVLRTSMAIVAPRWRLPADPTVPATG